ncbi:MAG: hypothetical protein IJL74_00345 [Bacilli bacterium]|nr:hypothetical protein [Bacilli bacterium]
MRSTMKCVDNKREVIKNKHYYAKLFSEGRESLERLLLTSYGNGTMTRACCAGHMEESINESYIYFRSTKKDLGLFSTINNYINNSELKDICVLREEIKLGFRDLDKYFLALYTPYDKADLVYDKMSKLIKDNANSDKVSTEYETIIALKHSLCNLKSRLATQLKKGYYDIASIEAAQINYPFVDYSVSKQLQIIKPYYADMDYSVKDLEELTKRIYDRQISDTDFAGIYEYQDNKQLVELQRVLKR